MCATHRAAQRDAEYNMKKHNACVGLARASRVRFDVTFSYLCKPPLHFNELSARARARADRPDKQWRDEYHLAAFLVIYGAAMNARVYTRENNTADWWQMARPWFNIYAIVMTRVFVPAILKQNGHYSWEANIGINGGRGAGVRGRGGEVEGLVVR